MDNFKDKKLISEVNEAVFSIIDNPRMSLMVGVTKNHHNTKVEK